MKAKQDFPTERERITGFNERELSQVNQQRGPGQIS